MYIVKRKVDDFLYEELTYKIRGCFFRVYNELGYGHKESVYQLALAEEFTNSNIKFEREKSLNIKYENKKVGTYKPDFIVERKVIIEIKAVEFVPKDFEKQLTYYLKGTDYKLGFLVNFGSPKLDIRRRVWTPSYQRQSA